MPLETQKRHCTVDRSPPLKENNENEIVLVNKKVAKTKQEIEHLKLELQKLISSGLCSGRPTKTDIKQIEQMSSTGTAWQPPVNNTNCDTDTNTRNDEKHITARRENVLLKCNKSNTNLLRMHQVPSNITTRFNYISLRKCKVSNENNIKNDCQKEKIEYNKEKTREYIRKQREKRAEQMKAKIRETQNEIDMRKKKLKELHDKSLQLVSKNIKQKRKRSRSCERKTTSENKQPSTCQLTAQDNLLFPKVSCDIQQSKLNFNCSDFKEVTNKLRCSLNEKRNGLMNCRTHDQLKSYSKSYCNKAGTELLEHNVNNDELLCKAATTIQAYYKGFRQRKLYKNYITTQQNENLEVDNAIHTNENSLEKTTKIAWLELPTTLPYPYNFINAVKKKLNFAVNKKIDETTQESSKSRENTVSSDGIEIETRRKNEKLKSKPNSVPTAEPYENHYIFFNEKAEAVNGTEAVLEEIKLSECSSTTWRDDGFSSIQPFDLGINLSEKLNNRTSYTKNKSDLKSFLSDKCPDLDLQTIKPLSLKPLPFGSQHLNKSSKKECASDSDTSKNIPDISTESSVHTNMSKPVHSLNSNFSNRTDDYNLVCNPERYNNLRRSRRRKLSLADETIQTLLPFRDDDLVSKGVNQGKKQDVSCTCLSKIQKKSLPLTKMFSNTDDNDAAKSTRETGNTEVSGSKKENMGNTAILSSFLSYMQCLEVKTCTKGNVENKMRPEDSKSATAFPSNSECKEEIDLMNLTEDPCETDERKYSSDFESSTSEILNIVPSLKCPSVRLNTSHVSLHKTNGQIDHLQVPLNQTFQFEPPKAIDTKINSNEIHLKFEAEIRLLHHFNKSLQEAVEKEKSLLENQYVPNSKNGDNEVVKEKNSNDNVTAKNIKSIAKIDTINYSRGSNVLNNCKPVFTTSNTSDTFENSFVSNTDLHLSNVRDINGPNNKNNNNSTASALKRQRKDHLCSGLSLGMFDQLIKDEDARIENLKTILKIREKSLLDRTKSELAWLEIQKRYLKDSGQLNELSMIKKKQRGLLVKLQHERHEMQRLKQMQKAASRERKTRLRQQRNMIKAQLSTNSETMSKLKSYLSRERQHSSGPLKVLGVYRYNESIISETSSFPKKSFEMIDGDNDMINLSRSSRSIVSSLSTDAIVACSNSDFSSNDFKSKQQEFNRCQNEHLKRSLLVKETALQKRRKVAEELLQWHQRLVEEERQISELESAANSIISQVTGDPYFSVQYESSSPNFTFKGCQLNVMWQNMTGRHEQHFKDNELYIMSNEAIQKFCKDAEKSNRGNFNRNMSNPSDNLKVVGGNINNNNNSNENIPTEIFDATELKKQENDDFLSISSASLTKSKAITERIVENIPYGTRNNWEASEFNYSEDFEEENCLTQNEIERGSIPDQNVDIFCKKESAVVVINELKTPASDISISIQLENIENIPSYNFPSTNEQFSFNESVSDMESGCLESNTETRGVVVQSHFEISENIKAENNSPTLNDITSISISDEKAIKKDDTIFQHISASTLTCDPSGCYEEETNGECSEKGTSNTTIEHFSIDYSLANAECKKITVPINRSIPDVINKVSGYESQNTTSDTIPHVQNKLINTSKGQPSKITEMPDILRKTYACQLKSTLDDEKGDLSASEVDFSLAITEHLSELNRNASSSDVAVKDYEQQVPKTDKKEMETENDEIEAQTDNKMKKDDNVTRQLEYRSTSIEQNDDGKDKDEKKKNVTEIIKLDKELLSKSEVNPLAKNFTTNNVISREEAAKFNKEGDNNEHSSSTTEKNDTGESTVGMGELEKDKCDYKDVRKRIFEILSNANVSRSEPNIRLRNLYITSHTSPSPAVSPESETRLDKPVISRNTFASVEEEELVKKQLAIEQEIKQIEQQQKEHLPYLYFREIPNKPPPPYTPPALTTTIPSVLPSSAEQVNFIVHHISNYLFNAHLNKTLPNVYLLPEIKRQMQSQIEPPCQRFIFDLCKELTVEHYKQYEQESGPSWMRIVKRPKLTFQKAFDERGLEKFLMKKVKETLGYEKINRKESMIIKWSRKRRDHVDELLVLESQNEEGEWTNYDKDELIVINETTIEIVNSLIDESAHVLLDILAKRFTNPN